MYIRTTSILFCIISICSNVTHESNMQYPPHETAHTPIKLVIFDLDGVLLKTSRFGIARHVTREKHTTSLFSFIRHALRKSPKKALFELMDAAHSCDTTQHTAWEPDGTVLPDMMVNWLAGVDGYDSYSIMHTLHDLLNSDTYDAEKYQVLRRIIPAIFDPVIRTRHTHLHKTGYHLFRKVQAQYPDCEYAILSNYDTSCFEHIRHKPELQRLFDKFDDNRIFISADLNMTKPHTQIYRYVAETCGVDPSECLFIDDQEINVIAAREAGMHAIRFTPKHARRIYTHIKNHYME